MKNKLIVMTAVLLAGSLARAEFKMNPDSNTLWIEDGKNIKTANTNFGGGWNNTDVAVTSNPDGGFYLEQKKQGKPQTGRMVPVSPEYPYVVYEVSELEMKPGYHALWLPLLGSAMTVLEGNVQKGVFAVNYYENSKLKPDAKQSFLGLHIHGLKVGFKYIKVVKVPDYYIKVESPAFAEKKYCAPGDKVKFTVYLKEEAEDVSLQFFRSTVLPLQINGSSKLQLLPVDGGNNKVWSAEITLKSIAPAKKDLMPLIKAVILGNETAPDALWGKSSYLFHIK